MKSRDISAMPSASARVAKRIEAAGGALLIGAFCDKRTAPETAPLAWRRKWQEMHPDRAVCPYSCRMDRLIAHIDMDAFYASVELLRYPRAARPRRRHRRRSRQPAEEARRRQPRVQLAAPLHRPRRRHHQHLRARKLGVFSAMGMMKSALLAPDAILLPVDFDEYRKYSRLFKAAVREIAPVIEDRGIDEIYVDLSDEPGVHDDAGRAIGSAIKAAVHERTGLTCSIGITPNKLLSKLASELDKPDGLTLLGHGRRAGAHLAARRAQGERHRPEGAARLAELGIETIGDIAAADPAFLLAHFGKSFGAWLHEASHGRDDRPVVTSSEPKSISRETPSTAISTRCAIAPSWARSSPSCASSSPATWRASRTPPRRSASSCASTTSRSRRAT
jgi:hypothetical protein